MEIGVVIFPISFMVFSIIKGILIEKVKINSPIATYTIPGL